MQDTILKICKQIHELLPTKRIAITRFVGKYEYGQIYVGELDRKVKREPCAFMFIKRDFCVVYSQDPAKNQEEARRDFEFVCRTLEDHCAFLFEPRWYKTFFDVFETTLILEFQVWERYERYPGSVIPVMEVLDSDYPNVVYDGSFVLSFTNTEHPDFPVELPNDIVADKNSYVKLPSVSGQHVEDDETWAPYAWDIGEFGQSVRMDSNKVANLLWRTGDFVTLSFENTTYPQFDVDLPDPMVVERGTDVTLPSVYGEFVEDDATYIPENWNIGGFGESVVVDVDTAANLLWRAVEPMPDYPQGQFTYGEMQTNPNKQVELNAIQFDSDEDELMAVTGNARDFINLEFIPDAGMDWVMSLNGLMEIWTGPMNPIAYFSANKSSVNLMSGFVYLLYDANGGYIPSDATKTYTPIRLIDSNGQTIENSLALSIRTQGSKLDILTWPSFTSASGVVAIEYKVE